MGEGRHRRKICPNGQTMHRQESEMNDRKQKQCREGMTNDGRLMKGSVKQRDIYEEKQIAWRYPYL